MVAALAVVFAGLLTWGLLRQTESAISGEAARQLARIGMQVADRYHYLLASFTQRQVPSPIAGGEEALLAQLTEAALAGHQGVEGGFFAAGSAALLGYAFPTYQGTGKKTDVPAAEREAILRVARRAVAEAHPVERRAEAAQDVILFHARPVFQHGQPEGAVWLMHRLSGLRASHRPLYGWGLVGLIGTSALLAAAAAVLVQRMSRGVQPIEASLVALEEDLGHQVPALPQVELQRIVAGVNRLGRALRDQAAERGRLETELGRADRLAALGRLVAGVAHEVRNPLASIKLKVERSLAGLHDPERLAANFAVIRAEIDRLDRLVERLLLLAKPSPPRPAPTDVARFLAERLDVVRTAAEARAIALRVEVADALPGPIPLERERLGQVLDNLLRNAVEAIPDGGGEIVISAMAAPAEPRRLAITVRDTGVGLPPGAEERLFEPFYSTKEGGTGLGLYLAAEVLRGLGGEIAVEAAPGGGTRVRVSLPW